MANEQVNSTAQRAIKELSMAELDIVSGGRVATDPSYPFPPQPSPTFPPVEI
jgi:hypothetical protein